MCKMTCLYYVIMLRCGGGGGGGGRGGGGGGGGVFTWWSLMDPRCVNLMSLSCAPVCCQMATSENYDGREGPLDWGRFHEALTPH